MGTLHEEGFTGNKALGYDINADFPKPEVAEDHLHLADSIQGGEEHPLPESPEQEKTEPKPAPKEPVSQPKSNASAEKYFE